MYPIVIIIDYESVEKMKDLYGMGIRSAKLQS